ALLLWVLLAGWRATRDPIAYFNEAAGGPRGGLFQLTGSNLDWGQARHRLRDWLVARPGFRPVGVAVYGTGSRVLGGLGQRLPAAHPIPGKYAVSARVMQGDAHASTDGDADSAATDKHAFAFFLRFEPIAVVGDSIYLFDVSLDDANRVRAEMGLPELDAP
ncbi:MAG: hypothetical protein ACRC33_20930, partial [Gemmataceae bacterium]